MKLAPFFIIGSPRSGTTLLRLMLASHPDLLVAPECGFAIWFAEKYQHLNLKDPAIVEQFADDVYRSKKFDTWGISSEELRIFLQASEATSYSDLVASVYACYGSRIGKNYKRWGDKNNFYLNHIAQLADLYPEARFIHIVRDGRDVACSYRELSKRTFKSEYAPNLSSDVETIAQEWKRNIKTVQNAFSELSSEQRVEIRFDDLVLNTEEYLRKLCEFIEVEYSPLMLNYHDINATQQLEPVKTMEWKVKTLCPPQSDTVSRYLYDLSAEEIKQFEDVSGGILVQYCFDMDNGER